MATLGRIGTIDPVAVELAAAADLGSSRARLRPYIRAGGCEQSRVRRPRRRGRAPPPRHFQRTTRSSRLCRPSWLQEDKECPAIPGSCARPCFLPSGCRGRARATAVLGCWRQYQRSKRRQGQLSRIGTALPRRGLRAHLAKVTDAAAAVFRRVCVEAFRPRSLARQPDAITVAGNRGEIGDDNRFLAAAAAACARQTKTLCSTSLQSIHSNPCGSQSNSCRAGNSR